MLEESQRASSPDWSKRPEDSEEMKDRKGRREMQGRKGDMRQY